MKTVIQRVNFASLKIDNKEYSRISNGLLLLIGFEADDNIEDLEWVSQKIINMRIFGDEHDKMNLSVKDIDGEIMIVSQFTLLASTKKGNRPSFIKAAKPEQAIPLYDKFVEIVKNQFSNKVATGKFGAYMKINFENDGPVTILLDSKNKE